MSTQNQPSVLVIGAGAAGLASSIHLANLGYDVTIYEKNVRPGGRCDRIEREGFFFDTGPTLYVMPHLYAAELESLGVSPKTTLDLQRVDPTYHLYFEDGTQLRLTSDLTNLGEQVDAFEKGASLRLLDYIAEGGRLYNLAFERLVLRHFRHPLDFYNLRNIPVFLQVKALSRHYQQMRKYFDDPRLKAAFTFQDMYMGLSPFKAPTTFSLMPYSELTHGVWYPRGGMYTIIEELTKTAQNAGVKLHLNTAIDKINVEGNQATGVTLENGDRAEADIVLANADLPYVYGNLLPQDGTFDKLKRKHYSCSTLSFFWGLDRRLPELEPHMLFLADDYKGGFEALNGGLLPDKPSLYVHCPTRLDPSLAPKGKDSLVGIVPIGHLDVNPEEELEPVRDQARRAIIERLHDIGFENVENHIEFETCFTPCSWRKRYNLYKGATHGLSHSLNQLAYLRPHNRHKQFHNLYFAGASTHPGTGLPTVLVSGRLAAERIQDEWGQ
jgi:phytoene desaturase